MFRVYFDAGNIISSFVFRGLFVFVFVFLFACLVLNI